MKEYPDLEVKLDWNVSKIETLNDGICLVSISGEAIRGNSVIVTCPPNSWSSIMEFREEKEVAANFIGGEKAIKVMLKFNELPWPTDLQGLICADSLPVPELWFRDAGDLHLAVCFLTSEYAEDLLTTSKGNQDEVTKIILQLSTVLSISLQELEAAHVETRMHVWDVGYMFPKAVPFRLQWRWESEQHAKYEST